MTVKEVIDVLSALLTPTIAVIATFIAVQQYRLSKIKTRFDLYQRRSSVFRCTMDLLTRITLERKVDNDALLRFARESSEAHFLFRSEVRKHLEELYRKALDLEMIGRKFEKKGENNGTDLGLLREQQEEIFAWFDQQFDVTREKFGKYLNLRA
jgi:hypothetical protein